MMNGTMKMESDSGPHRLIVLDANYQSFCATHSKYGIGQQISGGPWAYGHTPPAQTGQAPGGTHSPQEQYNA